MRIFGLPIPFTGEHQKALGPVPYNANGWYPVIHEPFPGAWQRNMPINTDSAASFHADFACKTLIARDIAKMRINLSKGLTRSGPRRPTRHTARCCGGRTTTRPETSSGKTGCCRNSAAATPTC